MMFVEHRLAPYSSKINGELEKLIYAEWYMQWHMQWHMQHAHSVGSSCIKNLYHLLDFFCSLERIGIKEVVNAERQSKGRRDSARAVADIA